jgi:hypothetical protein
VSAGLWTEPTPMTDEAGWRFPDRAEARWKQEARARGWRGGTDYHDCLAHVLGRRCHVNREDRNGRQCVCIQQLDALGHRVFDHGRKWTVTHTGQKVQTYEPYWDYLTPEQAEELLAEARAWCAGFGLIVIRGGRSPYYPGRTTLLIVQKAEEPAQ